MILDELSVPELEGFEKKCTSVKTENHMNKLERRSYWIYVYVHSNLPFVPKHR